MVIGAPRVGKSTYATKLAKQLGIHLTSTGKRTEQPEGLVSTDNYIKRGSFGDVPRLIIKDLKERQSFVLEGTQAARVVRTWLRDSPADAKFDKVVFVGNLPWVTHTKGQAAMGKAVRTVFREIEPLLKAAGVPIEHLSIPREDVTAEDWREHRAEALDDAASEPVDLPAEVKQDTPQSPGS